MSASSDWQTLVIVIPTYTELVPIACDKGTAPLSHVAEKLGRLPLARGGRGGIDLYVRRGGYVVPFDCSRRRGRKKTESGVLAIGPWLIGGRPITRSASWQAACPANSRYR